MYLSLQIVERHWKESDRIANSGNLNEFNSLKLVEESKKKKKTAATNKFSKIVIHPSHPSNHHFKYQSKLATKDK